MTDSELRSLILAGYEQVSRAYGIVARLPEGRTGVEALAEAANGNHPNAISWAMQLGERQAASHFRRVYANTKGPCLTLSARDLSRFRVLGGNVS